MWLTSRRHQGVPLCTTVHHHLTHTAYSHSSPTQLIHTAHLHSLLVQLTHTPHTHSLPHCWSLYGGSLHCASSHCAPLYCASSLHCASLHCGAQCPLSTTLPPASLLLLGKLALVVMTAKCSAPCSLVCRLEETVELSILCTSPALSRAPEKSSHVLNACLTLGRR